ncbi:MAG: signal recognition particle receptor subunit alpha, partial [Bdellovibrionales bacterium]|nr:signal recognition particle receptor subunit alpha [Bdellovibrionales bacterium]
MIWFFNKKKKEEQPQDVAETPVETALDTALDADIVSALVTEEEAAVIESALETVIADAAPEVEQDIQTETATEKEPEKEPEAQGWFARLKSGLSLSSHKITDGIAGIFTRRKLDQAAIDELEELLITADLGPATAARLTQAIAKNRFDKEVTGDEIRLALADEIEKILLPVEKPLFDMDAKPFVMLMVGV